MSELALLASLLGTGGYPLIVTIVVVGGMRGWYVFGRHYDALVKDRDDWRAIAQRGTADAERMVEWALKTIRAEKP